MNIAVTLKKALRLFPAREAVVDGRRRLTYTQVGRRVERLAAGLAGLGLASQDRLSIIAPNCLEFLEAYFAAALEGLIANPINFRLKARELAYIFKDAASRILLAHVDYAEEVSEALKEAAQLEAIIWLGGQARPAGGRLSFEYEEFIASQSGEARPSSLIGDDKPAHLYYTSGTTGRPKGVVLTHRNVTAHALAAIAEFHLTDRDVWFHIAPMFHLADAWAVFALSWVGGRHVMLDHFEAGQALRLIQEEKITLTNLIPTMINLMVNHPQASVHDYSSLRLLLSGGAPIAPETVRRIIETFGCDYAQTYGLTETSPYLTVSTLKEHLKLLPLKEQRAYISRTGREFLGVEIRVVEANGRDVPADDQSVGEVWARGETITPGYWGLPQETEAAFEDGWFKTGDLAVIDEEGYINIVDRKKDIILTGGENVYSTEVEYALYEHPAVLECAVIGVPDELWGEAVKAIVVCRPGQKVEAGELIAVVKERLAHYKAPKSVDFAANLPKTGSGKIMKRALKEAYWAGHKKRVH